jgi:glutathione peroxidase
MITPLRRAACATLLLAAACSSSESDGTASVAAPSAPAPETAMAAPTAAPASFHAFSTTTLEGQPVNLADYKGKVLLVVNTASACGLTPQYTGLEALHEQLSGRGFAVLGFPCNDFGGQEPGTPEQIREFCSSKYEVSFPLFAKVQTKAGSGQSPIYAWLGEKTGQLPRWNFGKYLIGKDGQVLATFDSKVPPEDAALRTAIDKALGG